MPHRQEAAIEPRQSCVHKKKFKGQLMVIENVEGRSFSEKPGDYMAAGVIMREMSLPYMVIARLWIYFCSRSENIGFPATHRHL